MPEQEKALLRLIADNPLLFEVLKKTIQSHFSFEKVNLNQTNGELGEVVRASIQGLDRLDSAFKEIAQLKTIPTKKEQKNPAR